MDYGAMGTIVDYMGPLILHHQEGLVPVVWA